MKLKLTIVKNTLSLTYCDYQALSPSLIDLLAANASPTYGPMNVGLKLLDCYCDLTNRKLTHLSLSSESLRTVISGFIGAVRSGELAEGERYSTERWVKTLLLSLSQIRTTMPSVTALPDYPWSEAAHEANWSVERLHLNPTKLLYWGGWAVTSLKGNTLYVAIPQIWYSHGPEFAEDIYLRWKAHAAKSARPVVTTLNKMLRFLKSSVQSWPACTFKDPIMLQNFFKAFMMNYFVNECVETKSRKGDTAKRASVAGKEWKHFMVECEAVFIQSGSWATPYGGGLPKPTTGDKFLTRLGERNGVVVHEKLITPVPLQLTDEEALEVLFHDVERDINFVVSWAESQADDLYSRAQRRKNLAEIATPLGRGKGYTLFCNAAYENHCSTFEKHGFPFTEKTFDRQHGEKSSKIQLAYDLGLPTARSLLPYVFLLISEHPQITPSFILGFELYDNKNKLAGFLETDTGYQLIGFKDRKQGKLSEQKIDLSAKSRKWIDQIIEITDPLRECLKQQGDDSWRELFLTCGAGFSYPRSAVFSTWNAGSLRNASSYHKSLKQEFGAILKCPEEVVDEFLYRVNPSSLRASCGVAVYLKTKSVEAMAEALGHSKYNPTLLRDYLPDSILAFFQSRWIRIFQRGIVCEAMKDSPYLLKATSFESMDELHTFLRNHALKDIPQMEAGEDPSPNNPTVSEVSSVYVSVSPGIMSALLSIEAAVDNAEEPNSVCAKAKYWASVSKLVTSEILRANDGLLKSHLCKAKEIYEPKRVQHMIYEK